MRLWDTVVGVFVCREVVVSALSSVVYGWCLLTVGTAFSYIAVALGVYGCELCGLFVVGYFCRLLCVMIRAILPC